MKDIKLTKIQKSIYVASISVILGLGTLLLTMSLVYAETILPNTSVNGIEVGGFKQSVATSMVDRSLVKKQVLRIKIDDEVIEEEAINLGITFDTEQAVTEAYLRGKSGSWFGQVKDLIGSTVINKDITVKADINTESLNNFINENVGSKISEPIDAYLDYANGQFVIVPAVDGKAIDLEKLKEDISQYAQSNKKDVIEAKVQIVKADVQKQDLVKYQKQIEDLVAHAVVIKAEDKNLVVTEAQKVSWYKLQKNENKFQIKIDKEAIAATVKQLSKNYDLVMVKEQINTKGEVIVAGRDGKAINQAQVVADITAAIASQNAVTVVANVSVVPREQIVATANSIGVIPAVDTELKFVQIDIANQKMYLFENREVVNSFSISSGKSGMDTPKGVHKIYNKALRPYSKKYGLYMPYWNSISADGQFGIHELPEWPNGYKEGESHLGIPVSHGCIRLGVGAAAYVYEWAPIGTAVVIQ